MKDGYIPKDQRKKILLLSDDFRMPSGVGRVSQDIILGTAHRYNWVQLGAAVVHPELGKVVDASQAVADETGVTDAYCRIFPYNGYGDAPILRRIIEMEKPDAILHFTDPRYWIWLYQMEHEVRQQMPLMFYHVWDDLPYPKYNEQYYQSCDFISCISRQTYNIVRQVWQKNEPKNWRVQYNPHGINSNMFKRLTAPEDVERVNGIRNSLLPGDNTPDFVILYNNRNIRRKMTGDVILAVREFVLKLPVEKRNKVVLLMHTQPVDENGTDLHAVARDCAPEINVVFSAGRVDTKALNDIYNASDVVINLASNEGFGLGTLEAMMAERMIVVNVTGGLQDQCGFKNEDGDYVHEDREFGPDWGSNHDGRFQQHGEWVKPIFPVSRALIGSPPTPYIFDDRCSWEEAAVALREIYNMSPEERQRRGASGREYATTQGFDMTDMCNRFIEGIDSTFENWKPRSRFELIKVA